MNEKIIISASSAYNAKYYINPEFTNLPKEILEKIQILVVTLAQKTGGIVQVGYTKTGDLFFEVTSEENDFSYDEINAKLEVNRAKDENQQLINGLLAYYKLFISEDGKELVKNMNPKDIENFKI